MYTVKEELASLFPDSFKMCSWNCQKYLRLAVTQKIISLKNYANYPDIADNLGFSAPCDI
jgi:hypothetical protein